MNNSKTEYQLPFILSNNEDFFNDIQGIAYKIEKIKKRQEIQHDSIIDKVIYVKKGRLKMVISNYAGVEKLWLYAEANTFCMPAALDRVNQIFNVKLTIDEDSELLFMNKYDYFEKVLSNRKLLDEFLNAVGQRFAITSCNLMLDDTSRNKIYKFIYYMAIKNSDQKTDNCILIKNFPSRNDIASLTGVHVTNVTKYFTELKKQGIVQRIKRDIIITNLDRFKNAIDQEDKSETLR